MKVGETKTIYFSIIQARAYQGIKVNEVKSVMNFPLTLDQRNDTEVIMLGEITKDQTFGRQFITVKCENKINRKKKNRLYFKLSGTRDNRIFSVTVSDIVLNKSYRYQDSKKGKKFGYKKIGYREIKQGLRRGGFVQVIG